MIKNILLNNQEQEQKGTINNGESCYLQLMFFSESNFGNFHGCSEA